MCILETKTYIHSDGERTVESLRLCHRAVGNRPCNRLERRNTEPIRVVEVRPPAERNTSDGVLITEGFNGRQTRYRDVSIRSSGSSSLRRSMTMGERSPISFPSSVTSSPSIVEAKPEAPSPPPAVPGFPFRTRPQSPHATTAPGNPPLRSRHPPTSPPDPYRTVTPEGTAVYDRPPSLELPRAFNNERTQAPGPREQTSASSMRAEVDDATEPGPSARRRRPSITIDDTRRPSPPPASQGADPEPVRRRTSLRRDAGAGSSRTTRRAERPIIQQENPPQPSQLETEEERQARLERGRLAETNRRQPARDQLARDASRERHRRAAAEALERPAAPPDREDDSIQQNIRAERDQMAREQQAAAARRRRESDAAFDNANANADAARRFAEDHVVRGADGFVRFVTERNSIEEPYSAGGARGSPMTGPSSPRLSRNPPPPPPPAVHQQDFSPRRRSNNFRDRGDEVIAREQTRAATERLSEALGDVGLSERERERERERDRDRDRYAAVREEDEGVMEEVDLVTEDGRRYRRYRRRRDGRRSGRRDRPAQQFYQ